MLPSILRKLPGVVGKNLPTFYGLFPGFTYFGRMFCLFFSSKDAVESWVPRDELLVIRTAEAFGVCEGAPAVRQLPSNSLEGWDG